MTRPDDTASRTPPKPAIAAERANTAVFVRAAETPMVTVPGSVARSAAIARPELDRIRFRTSRTTIPSTIARNMIIDRESARSTGPSFGGLSTHPPTSLRLTPRNWKKRFWQM